MTMEMTKPRKKQAVAGMGEDRNTDKESGVGVTVIHRICRIDRIHWVPKTTVVVIVDDYPFRCVRLVITLLLLTHDASCANYGKEAQTDKNA